MHPEARTRRRAIATAIALAALVAGCGSTSVASPPPADRTETGQTATPVAARPVAQVCREVGTLGRLVLMRDDAFPGNHLRFSLPSVVSTSRAVGLRVVARALCASPPVPKGRINCPMDLGVTYYLAFSGPRGTLSDVVILEAAGCTAVRGLGPTRWASPASWKALGAVFGVAPSAFRGSLPRH